MHLHKMHKYHKMHHRLMHHHRGPPRFNETEDEALLSAVSQFPALFDVRHEDYKNGKVKTDIWDNIALLLNRDVEICKRRWKDIRDNYYKIKRKHKMENCRWPLAGKLVFLDSAGPERRMGRCKFESEVQFSSPEASPLTEVDNERQDTEDIGPCTSKIKEVPQDGARSLPRQQEPQKRPTQDDDVDLFMKSIAIQVRKMSPQMVARAKLNILTAVHDLQFESSSNVENLVVNEVEQIPGSLME